MPILTADVPPPALPGALLALVAAQPGVTATAAGTPLTGPVVAWAQVADDQAPGGSRIDPVLLAAGRCWTPDQVRAAHGPQATVSVT